MGGASKTFKKITSGGTLRKRFAPNPFDQKEVEGSFANPGVILTESVKDAGDLFTPDIPEPEEGTIIPIPSERTAELKARKRRAKAKTSGRQSTILTEGLGG